VDACVEEGGTTVSEAVCLPQKDGTLVAARVNVQCPKGTVCKAGACVLSRTTLFGGLGGLIKLPPGRRRRSSTPVTWAEAFPDGICGCGSKFPKAAEGSYFSLDNGATPLSEAKLEGLTREEVGRLYFHPVADYFGRVGFTINGVSLEHATEFAVTTAKLGITVNADNDAPVLSVPVGLQGHPAFSAQPNELVAVQGLGVADNDAMDGTVRATLTTASGRHAIYVRQLDGIRLVEHLDDPRSAVTPAPQHTLNGAVTLRLEGTVAAVNSSLGDLLLRVGHGVSGRDILIINFTDAFWSGAEDRGSEGVTSATVEFEVLSSATTPPTLELAQAVLFFNSTQVLCRNICLLCPPSKLPASFRLFPGFTGWTSNAANGDLFA